MKEQLKAKFSRDEEPAKQLRSAKDRIEALLNSASQDKKLMKIIVKEANMRGMVDYAKLNSLDSPQNNLNSFQSFGTKFGSVQTNNKRSESQQSLPRLNRSTNVTPYPSLLRSISTIENSTPESSKVINTYCQSSFKMSRDFYNKRIRPMEMA